MLKDRNFTAYTNPDYFLNKNLVNRYRFLLTIKLVIFKIIIGFLLIELIVLPWYLNITPYILNNVGFHIISSLLNLEQILNFISIILFISVVKFSYEGHVPSIEFVSVLSVIILLIFDGNYILWPLKIIFIFLLLKLGRLIERFQIALINYKDYDSSFVELERLNKLVNNVLGTYIVIGFFVTGVVYGLLIMFNLITFSLDNSLALFFAVFILPPIIIYMFSSPAVLKSVKDKTVK